MHDHSKDGPLFLDTDGIVHDAWSYETVTKRGYFTGARWFMDCSVAKLINQSVFITGTVVQSEGEVSLKLRKYVFNLNSLHFLVNSKILI